MTEKDYSNIDVDNISVDYTKEDAQKAAARKVLHADWYIGLVGDCKRAISKGKGHLMLSVLMKPLKDPQNPESVTGPFASGYIVLPFKNPEIPDHEPPDVGNMLIPTMRAFFPTEIGHIERDKESGAWYFEIEGKERKEIDPEKVDAKRVEIAEAAFGKAVEVWNDPTSIVRENFGVYFQVQHQGDFVSVSKFRAQLPDGVEPRTVDMATTL